MRKMDILIAHISDPHVGKINFIPEKMEICIDEVNSVKPDLVAITGDITIFGFKSEYEEAKKYIDRFKSKTFVIPGNHDARYLGYIYFEQYFGKRERVMDMSDELSIIGIDSSVPDLDEGTVGRGKQKWLKEQLQKIPGDKLKIVAIHHHIIPIPMTGRERNVLTDAGDVLKILVENDADLVLCGHRHTPYAWFVNNVSIITAGSPSTEKVRATIPQSYNLIRITDDYVEVKLKEVAGEEKLMARYQIIKGKDAYQLVGVE